MSHWNTSNGYPSQREYVSNPNLVNYPQSSADFNHSNRCMPRNNFVTGVDHHDGSTKSMHSASTSRDIVGVATNNFNKPPNNRNLAFDVSHSNLTPTAREFTPSSSRDHTYEDRTTGAVKKKQYSKNRSKPANTYKTEHKSQNSNENDHNTNELGFSKNQSKWPHRNKTGYNNKDDSSSRNENDLDYNVQHKNLNHYERRYSNRNDYRKYPRNNWNSKTYYKRNSSNHEDESYNNLKDASEYREERKSWRQPSYGENNSSKMKGPDKRNFRSANYLKKKCKYFFKSF